MGQNESPTEGDSKREIISSLATPEILDVCSYLLLLGVAARALVYYFLEEADAPVGATLATEGHEYRFLVLALLGGFSLLAVLRQRRLSILERHSHFYLGLQALLVAGMLLVPPHLYYFAILFFLLSIQAMLVLPRQTGYAWIGAFCLIAAGAILLEHGFAEGIGQVLVFVAGFYFFGTFAAATAQTEAAHRQTRQLVNELQLREEALRQSEERYRRVVEGCPDSIVILNASGELVEANDAACRLIGRPLAEVLRLPLAELYPDYDQVHRDYVASMLGSPDPDQRVHLKESSLRRGDGSLAYVEAQLGVIRLKGQPHVLVIARDVTQRREAQEEIFRQTRELAVLEERNRLAREIHDTLAQGFTGIVVQLEAAEQALAENGAARRHLESAKNLARTSLQEARRSVWDLLPQSLESQSLMAALNEEVGRFNEGGRVLAKLAAVGKARRLPPSVELGILRICQESLTNVRRHAGASQVSLHLEFIEDRVRLTINDNGRGFDHDVLAGDGAGFGLRGMSERARLLGGELRIRSGENGGAEVEVSIPLQAVPAVQVGQT